ncbi:MAG: hypothetical protein MMC33_002842 [Icmadophila ericetorum]|nr:hypothetical protein [Icmadophila ericetorum]
MPQSLDPAIVNAITEAFSMSPEQCDIKPSGGAGFSTSSKITAFINGETKYLFLKTGSEADMFKGEHASLAALYSAVPSICPMSLGHGKLENSSGSFLLTEFLDLNARDADKGTGLSLAQKLAKLHTTSAPIPDGCDRPMFGFHTTTYCGSTPQENTYRKSWSEFYAENRLRAIAMLIERKPGADTGLLLLIEKTAMEVVPRLLGDGHLGGEKGIFPVVVHGDLWSGNKNSGRIGGSGSVEAVVYDPSSCYAHSEYDLGIMKMFGGFDKKFYDTYYVLVPKTEPENEYNDRVELYELYHQLNHYLLFGGSYKSSAVAIMKRLSKNQRVSLEYRDLGSDIIHYYHSMERKSYLSKSSNAHIVKWSFGALCLAKRRVAHQQGNKVNVTGEPVTNRDADSAHLERNWGFGGRMQSICLGL